MNSTENFKPNSTNTIKVKILPTSVKPVSQTRACLGLSKCNRVYTTLIIALLMMLFMGEYATAQNSLPGLVCTTISCPSSSVLSVLYMDDLESWTGINGSNPIGTNANGWTNTSGLIVPNWRLKQGATTPLPSGPAFDHTLGSNLGRYVYLETSGGALGDYDNLISPEIDLSAVTSAELSFWYHMFGIAIGSLEVYASSDTSNIMGWIKLDSIIGQQQTAKTDSYINKTINLDVFAGAPVYLQFRGIRGNSFLGDIAIDDVEVSGASGGGAAITQNTDAEMCTAVINNIAPIVSNNCSVVNITYSVTGATTASGVSDASGIAFNTGISTVTYTVTDSLNNQDSCSFDVTVIDNEIPIITCPGNITQSTDVNVCTAVVNGIAPIVGDNCSVAGVTYTIVGATVGNGNNDASGTTFSIGTSVVKYVVTDVAGNKDSCSFNVTVEDNTAPSADCQNVPAQYLSAQGSVQISLSDVQGPWTIDACGLSSVTINDSVFDCSHIGQNTVTMTVVDVNNNSSNCTVNVLVIDSVLPSIYCPSDIVVTATSAAGAVVNYTTPVATDNCSGVSISLIAGFASGDSFPIGVTTVTYYAMDASGNATQCSFTVTVSIGSQPPQIVCPQNIVLNSTSGQCGANVNFAATETAGNPASAITYTHAPGSFFPVGSTTITATASNGIGTSDCTFDITVNDIEAPVISGCPVNIIVCVDSNVVFWTPPTATDNCTLLSFTGDHFRVKLFQLELPQ